MAKYYKSRSGAVKQLNSADLPEMMSTIQAAQYLGVNSNTIGNWIRAGLLPASKFPGSSIYRINKADLLEYVNRCKGGAYSEGI